MQAARQRLGILSLLEEGGWYFLIVAEKSKSDMQHKAEGLSLDVRPELGSENNTEKKGPPKGAKLFNRCQFPLKELTVKTGSNNDTRTQKVFSNSGVFFPSVGEVVLPANNTFLIHCITCIIDTESFPNMHHCPVWKEWHTPRSRTNETDNWLAACPPC